MGIVQLLGSSDNEDANREHNRRFYHLKICIYSTAGIVKDRGIQ